MQSNTVSSPSPSPSPSSSSLSLPSSPYARAAIGSAGVIASFLLYSLLRKRGNTSHRIAAPSTPPSLPVSSPSPPFSPIALVPPVPMIFQSSEVPPSASPVPAPTHTNHSQTVPIPLSSKPFSFPVQRQFVTNNSHLNLSTFRVVSYNILADGPRYALGDSLSYCPIEYRKWEYRWPRIANEILQYCPNSPQNGHPYHHSLNRQGGVICIQEATPTVFKSTLEPFFSLLNYDSFMVQLADPYDFDKNERQINAVFVNRNVFEVVKIESLPYAKLSEEYFEHLMHRSAAGGQSTGPMSPAGASSPPAADSAVPLSVNDLSDGDIHDHSVSEPSSPKSVNSAAEDFDLELSENDQKFREKMSWFRDTCVILHLRYKAAEAGSANSNRHQANPNGLPPGCASGQDVIVLATHLHYHPANPEVKTFQSFLACRAMARFARDQLFPGMQLDEINWDTVPLVIAGDLNSTPCKLFTDQYDPILPKSGLVSGVYELMINGRLSSRHPHHPASFIPKVEYLHGPRDRGVPVERVIEPSANRPERSDSQSSLNSSVSSSVSDISDSLLPSFILPFRFASTYATTYGHEPPFTHKTGTFQGCIDYIFINSGALRLRSVLDLPFDEIDRLSEAELETRAKMEADADYYPGFPYLSRESSKIRNAAGKGTMGSAGEFPPMPTRDYPSDHFMLAAELEIIPIREIIERQQREEREELESGRASVSALSSRRESINEL